MYYWKLKCIKIMDLWMLHQNSLQEDKLPTLVIGFLDMENVHCFSCFLTCRFTFSYKITIQFASQSWLSLIYQFLKFTFIETITIACTWSLLLPSWYGITNSSFLTAGEDVNGNREKMNISTRMKES